MILKDKTEIEVQEGVSLSDIQTIKNNMSEVEELKNKLTTKGNLDSVIFMQDETPVGEYEDMVLNSPMLIINETEDQKLSVSFGIREKTDIEKRLDTLEESQAIQDGAIADLGSVIGEMSL